MQVLAHNAVHAAFAGYTGVTVGLVNTHHVYLPVGEQFHHNDLVETQWSGVQTSGAPDGNDGQCKT